MYPPAAQQSAGKILMDNPVGVSVVKTGKYPAAHVHLPQALGGLLKGGLQLLDDLLGAQFPALEFGYVRGGDQHDRIGVVVVDVAGPDMHPYPALAVGGNPMGMARRLLARQAVPQHLIQARKVIRMNQGA